MPRRKQITAKDLAQDVLNQFSCSVGDIALTIVDWNGKIEKFSDPDWVKKVMQAKKNGVSDLHGWLADELYNDPDTIDCYMGDWIVNAIGEAYCYSLKGVPYQEKIIEVYNELATIGHTAVTNNCIKRIEKEQLRLKELIK